MVFEADQRASLTQTLKDADCDQGTIACYLQFKAGGKDEACLSLLAKQRSKRLARCMMCRNQLM